MDPQTLTVGDVLKTRTAQAAIMGGVAVPVAAYLVKYGVSVPPEAIGQLVTVGITAACSFAAAYFRSKAPVRDRQSVVTPRPYP